MIKFACANWDMFDRFISRHEIARDFTTLDPTCIVAPPIRLVLSEPLSKHTKKIAGI